MEDEILSFQDSCSAGNCGTGFLSAKVMLEAITASTPNLNHLSTDPKESVSNSHFPGTKSLLATPQLLPNLLKYSIERPSAERGPQYFI